MRTRQQSSQPIAIAAPRDAKPAARMAHRLIGALAATMLALTGAGAALTGAPEAAALGQGPSYRDNLALANAVDYYWSQRNVNGNNTVAYFPQMTDGADLGANDGTSQDLTLNDAGGHVGSSTVRKYTSYLYELKPGRSLNVTVSNGDDDNTDDWNMFTLAMSQVDKDGKRNDQVVVHVGAPRGNFPGIRYDANNRGRTVVDWLKGGQSATSLTNLISFTGEPQAVGGVYPIHDVAKGAISESLGVRNSTDESQFLTVTVLPGILSRRSGDWTNYGHWNVRFTEGNFTDVTSSTPHSADIDWLAAQGITTGFADGSFGRMRGVVRQDMAAFLYRLAGSPAYTPSAADKARFRDVTDSTPHAKEIRWLGYTGIAQGYEDGTFGGMNTVVRQDMAAFLHRYANAMGANPTTGQGVTFTDLVGAAHVDDIQWLAKTGVTTGWENPDGKTAEFRGMNTVVRQDMAAFLHRMKTNVLGK